MGRHFTNIFLNTSWVAIWCYHILTTEHNHWRKGPSTAILSTDTSPCQISPLQGCSKNLYVNEQQKSLKSLQNMFIPPEKLWLHMLTSVWDSLFSTTNFKCKTINSRWHTKHSYPTARQPTNTWRAYQLTLLLQIIEQGHIPGMFMSWKLQKCWCESCWVGLLLHVVLWGSMVCGVLWLQ